MSRCLYLAGKAVRNPRKAAQALGDRFCAATRVDDRFHAAVISYATRAAIAFDRTLPVEAQVQIRSSLSPVVNLDYTRARLSMSADTPMVLMRANACAKEPKTVAWIEDSMGEGDVLYDIGANVGAYSLVAGAVSHGAGTVYAFEPSFSTFAQLCKNVLLNGMQDVIRPFMIALGRTTEFAVLNYSTIDAGAALHALGRPIDQDGVAFAPAYRQTIPAFSIDDLVARCGLRAPTLVKLDVDGTEIDILEGAMTTLTNGQIRSLVIEVVDAEDKPRRIERLLETAGYELVAQDNRAGNVANYTFMRASWPDA